MTRPKRDARLRARFREIAREIVLQDRVARKSGALQNTIGEIDRGLVRAFALGRDTVDALQPWIRPERLGIA